MSINILAFIIAQQQGSIARVKQSTGQDRTGQDRAEQDRHCQFSLSLLLSSPPSARISPPANKKPHVLKSSVPTQLRDTPRQMTSRQPYE